VQETSILKKSEVTRGTVFIAVQNAVQFSINLIFMMALARILPQEEIGSISALTFSFVIFVTISTFSLPTAATKFISEHLGGGDLSQASSVFVAVRKYVLLFSTACLVVACIFSGDFSFLVWGTRGRGPVFIAVFLAAYTFVLRNVHLACLRGLQLFDRYAATVISVIAFGRAIAISLAWLGFGVIGVPIGWFAGELLGLALSLFFCRGRLPKPGDPYPWRKLFEFSWPVQTERVISTLADWSDQMLLLAATSDLVLLGTYFLCVRGAASLSIIWLAFNVTVMPTLSRIFGQSGKKRLAGALGTSLRYLLFLLLPAAFGLAVLSRSVMILLGGSMYEGGALPLSILAFGSILQAIAYILMSALNAIAETKAFVKISVANVVTNVSLVLLLSPRFGILGASIARVGMWTVSFLLMLNELRNHIRIELDWSAILKCSLSSVLMAISVTFLDNLLSSSSNIVLRIIVEIGSGILVYSAFLLLLRTLGSEDFSLLRALFPERLHGLLVFLEQISRW
jgi:O-antigen/teichoic acid export membrane protein